MRSLSPRSARSGRTLPTPRSGSRRGRGVRLAGLVLLAAGVAGCYSASGNAGPTPADFTGITASFVAHGIAIDHVVSGEAGCTDATLTPTAISFDAQGADQKTPVRVHLYIFRDGSVYTRLRSEVDACAKAYVTNPTDYATVDTSPYVAAGAGPWAARFKEQLRVALQQAATPDTVGP